MPRATLGDAGGLWLQRCQPNGCAPRDERLERIGVSKKLRSRVAALIPLAPVRSVHWLISAAFFFVALGMGTALAANEEGAFVSNESVLLGGAARSVVRDGGAAWLNPARLTQIRRMSLNANINALRLYHERIPDALSIKGGDSTSISQTNIGMLPSSMSMGMALNHRLSLGLGVFVSKSMARADNIILETEVPPHTFQLVAAANQRSQDYNAVAALGWKATPRSNYGLSLILRYERQEVSTANWMIFQEPAGESVFITTQHQQLTRLGLGFIVGGSWETKRKLIVSAVVQTPMFMLVDVERGVLVTGSTTPGEDSRSEIVHNIARGDRLGADARAVGSIRAHIGVAWPQDNFTLSGELEFRMEPQVAEGGYETVYNARLGAQGYVRPRLQLGGGVFTDLTQKVELTELSQSNVQYVGTSFGLRWTKRIRLAEEERVRSIERSSVVGVRYLAGFGRYNGVQLDLASRETDAKNVPFAAHELSLYFGTEMAF